VEETIEFVAGLAAEDRIAVVQATYEAKLLMAEGRRRESRRSDTEIRSERERATGSRFACSSCRSPSAPR
jgi:hypothetical protein